MNTADLFRRALGAPRKFETPEALAEAVAEYFEHVDDNPLEVGASGKRMRAATLAGLCQFIGITTQAWGLWRGEGEHSRPDLFSVMALAEDAMREQKFTGAAAGLLNANIIARDLGLAEKREEQVNLNVTGVEITFARKAVHDPAPHDA